MNGIQGPVQTLVNAGLMEVLLPFVLIFSITWGVLERTQVLGEDKRKENAMTAVAIAFLSVFAVKTLNIVGLLVSYMSLVFITGMMIAIIFGIVGARTDKPNKMLSGVVGLIFFITLLFVFTEAGLIDKNVFFSKILFPLILLVAAIGLIAYFIKKR